MNYPYPIPHSQSNVAAFVANSTLSLGSYTKPLDARTLLFVDYSKLVPAVMISSFAFRVRPGGEPQLGIESVTLGTPANSLTFFVKGGIAGQAYQVILNMTLVDGEVRSDTLTVNVSGDDCGCGNIAAPPATQGVVSGDGSVIVNQSPRFFLSYTPPINANVMDWWYNTAADTLYQYITNGVESWWWEAGVAESGSGGGVGANNIVAIMPISPNGVTTTFILSAGGTTVNIGASDTLFVSVDGVWQQPGAQYAASGNTITFTQAPSADSVIFMLWFAPPASS